MTCQQPCLGGLVTYGMNVVLCLLLGQASRARQLRLLVHPEEDPSMTQARQPPVPLSLLRPRAQAPKTVGPFWSRA